MIKDFFREERATALGELVTLRNRLRKKLQTLGDGAGAGGPVVCGGTGFRVWCGVKRPRQAVL